MNNRNNTSDFSKMNIDQAKIDAVKRGDKKALLNSLSKDDLETINTVLNDKQKLEGILKSPQAIAILKALGGKNG